MITEIKFKAGPSQQTSPLDVKVAPITVFVGPNNAGKSQVLRELYTYSGNSGLKIIDGISYANLSDVELSSLLGVNDLSELTEKSHSVQTISASSHDQNKSVGIFSIIDISSLPNIVITPGASVALANATTLRLDGKVRLNILDEVSINDFQNPSINILSQLFLKDELREKAREIIYDAIGKYIVIDPTKPGILRVRFSNHAPSNIQERSFTDDAIAFHSAAENISELSDGVRAFAGIVTALIASEPKIILIDEPEAFLHPALAMKLGKEIGSLINEPYKRLFASTHSASFIMGCIQSRAPISVVRLTYKGGIGTTRVLERDKLLHLMRNPMLRSTGVIEGLFYEAVIVTEADADRAFYQEINERLISAKDSRAISNCLFLNAQNKQTVWDIVKPLRELGIPAIGIIDLDMIKDNGTNAIKIMDGAFVPEIQRVSLGQFRSSINQKFNEIKLPDGKTNWKNLGGIDLLNQGDKQAANTFFGQLEEFGIFVVRVGELEDWLPHLGISATNKKDWLPSIFVAMGEEPTAAGYVTPGPGDVWDFVGRIKNWIENPIRLGIPE